ncbi:MAG: DUF6265 family protein [Sphingomicrobium sp.]
MIRFVLSLALILLSAAPGHAQETRQAVAGQPAPTARLSDLAWLAGAWGGEGLTGPAREVYSPPLGGQIIGHFIQTRGKEIAFSEILSIAQVGDTLEYRLKHFNADLTGWEEKDEVSRFPLVAVEGDAFYFDGLTIRRAGPDGLVSAVRMENSDGTSRDLVFRYRRSR